MLSACGMGKSPSSILMDATCCSRPLIALSELAEALSPELSITCGYTVPSRQFSCPVHPLSAKLASRLCMPQRKVLFMKARSNDAVYDACEKSASSCEGGLEGRKTRDNWTLEVKTTTNVTDDKASDSKSSFSTTLLSSAWITTD